MFVLWFKQGVITEAKDMDNEVFFGQLEQFTKQLEGQKCSRELEAVFHYSTGEAETFKVCELFRANLLVIAKKRDKYVYINDTLISLDHVVKVKFNKPLKEFVVFEK